MAKKRNPKKSKVQQSSNINEVNKQIDVQNTETDENINKNNAVNTEAVTAQNTPVISRQKEAAAPLKGKEGSAASSEQIKGIALSVLKVLLPVAACAIVIAFIISIVSSNGVDDADSAALNLDKNAEEAHLNNEPLQENAYENVNELMRRFFKALGDGDMDTIVALMDYNDDTSLITYEKRSEFIDEYANVTCYTKPGLDENSYFVYVSYDVKIKDIETTAPGLNAFYVYTAEDGSLKIDGDMEKNVDAAFKLVTNQDDVVDLYNRIDVDYKYAVASDETLNTFMEELPGKVKTEVGVALAQLEGQNDETAAAQESEGGEAESTQEPQPEEEQPQNQAVNQLVRAIDTVNVRKSDSEEADRIGKVSPGTELTRIEERINGWSKVIYEGTEAYIKSDYLEVISTEEAGEVIGSVKATTNVNVRSAASQDSEKLGVAQADTSYELLQDLGEWYRIKYNGITGYVKAEFFE
ncbi:hypothetical protein C809_02401 [Lachnospiraceae bacterium MD335]|nr:hypothetical protein C809_02401 [Lachnospiraceae bacterium MD335]